MSDHVLKTGQRSLVREIKHLLRDRAEREGEMESRFDAERKAIDSHEASTRQRIEDEYNDATQAAQCQRDQDAAATRSTYERKKAGIKKAYAEDRAALLSRAEENEQEARKQHDEQVWLAETVYEASHDQPGEECEREKKLAESRVEEAQLLRDDTAALLRRVRMGAIAQPPDAEPQEAVEPDINPVVLMDEAVQQARDIKAEVETLPLLKLFRGWRPAFLLVFAAAIGLGADWLLWADDGRWALVVALPVLVVLAMALAYFIVRSRAGSLWQRLNRVVDRVGALKEPCVRFADSKRDGKLESLRETRDREVAAVSKRHEEILAEIHTRRDRRLERIEEKYPALLEDVRADYKLRSEEIEKIFAEQTEQARTKREKESAALDSDVRTRREELEQWYTDARTVLESDWKAGITRTYDLLNGIQQASARLFPPWDEPSWNNWSPPHEFAPAIPFATIHVDLNSLEGGVPEDTARLPIPGPVAFDIPATLTFPDRCSLLIQRDSDDDGRSVRVLQDVMMRILTCVPPGKARFTIIDPVGLGQNFAGFMHLADYNDALIGGKIWTEPRHIEQRLTDLTEHMENVIQKYLRNEYETIDEYNEQAGEIAEPYRFLVLADFPANFSESSMKRLASIVSSGARCGVHTLIAMDTRQKMLEGLDINDLQRTSLTIHSTDDGPRWIDDDFGDLPLVLEEPPQESFITRTLNLVGQESIEAGRVEVPFEVIAPPEDALWSLSTRSDFRVPLGRCGATKLQYLTLGRGTAQHALIAGKTGSGKSTLLHALVTNLALWYSPDEVELYLIDFKKGVEFKTYATHRLPHLRALAIESDREFGVSVLHRIDEELQRRGERFRQLGVQDLAGFRNAAPNERMPRTLLVIDEFQELFTEDDRLGQDASMLLDRLVRQGRAFGIHVLLGSQTLGGAYSLARSTLGQMAVRIALQCSEADSYLILSDDNAAARLLSRPGEAIYNDASGQLEGNSPFQVVWLPEEIRERHLSRLHDLPQRNGQVEPPIIFEGNVAADIHKNHALEQLLNGNGKPLAGETLAWLGDAIAIKDPTAARFRRQSGHNLLIVGQREDAAQAMMISSMASIAAQSPSARFHLLDGSVADTDEAKLWANVTECFAGRLEHVRVRETPQIIQSLSEILEQRQQSDRHDAEPIFLMVYGLHRFRDLRHTDDFSYSADDTPPSTDKLFATLLREGPPLGIHVIAWCDTVNNINRTLDRQGLREFEMRVLFQMSPTDSAMLIDTPAAGKLGYHRALYYSEEEGRHEKFRPYAPPPQAWLQRVRDRLNAIASEANRSPA